MKLYLLALPIDHTCVSQYEKEFALQSPYNEKYLTFFSLQEKPGSSHYPGIRASSLLVHYSTRSTSWAQEETNLIFGGL